MFPHGYHDCTWTAEEKDTVSPFRLSLLLFYPLDVAHNVLVDLRYFKWRLRSHKPQTGDDACHMHGKRGHIKSGRSDSPGNKQSTSQSYHLSAQYIFGFNFNNTSNHPLLIQKLAIH